jgi:hypothetical protein
MNAISVVVISELVQLPLKINRVPEERAIQILSPDRVDQPFDERMGNWGVRHRLDLLDLQHAQVGKPPLESEKRVVIGRRIFKPPFSLTATVSPSPASGQLEGVSLKVSISR